MTQTVDPGQAVVAKQRLMIDGRVIEPGERLPDSFTNRSDELIKMLLRTGYVEPAPAPSAANDPDDKEELLRQIEALDYASLRETCRLRGLPFTGSKDVLRQRLKDFLLGA